MSNKQESYHDGTLPIATTLPTSDVHLLSSHNQGDFKKSDSKITPFELPSTGTGTNQQVYWGRFNDATAQVVGDAEGNDSSYIPVATAHLDDRAIRHAFIRKVYMILSAQLLATFAVCALMAWNTSVLKFCIGPGFVLYYLNIVVAFGSLCALNAYKRRYPTNFYLLGVFSLSMAYMVGIVTALYTQSGEGALVLEAVFITATVFIGLTIFTLQSKWDFSFLGAGLGVCLWILILWGFFGAIFGVAHGYVYALFGSILFSGYIIFDTYLIAERLDPEDYIVASIELYLDLVNLFLMILRLLSEANGRH